MFTAIFKVTPVEGRAASTGVTFMSAGFISNEKRLYLMKSGFSLRQSGRTVFCDVDFVLRAQNRHHLLRVVWRAIERYAVSRMCFGPVIWSARKQKYGSNSFGTRIQPKDRSMFTAIFKLTPVEGRAASTGVTFMSADFISNEKRLYLMKSGFSLRQSGRTVFCDVDFVQVSQNRHHLLRVVWGAIERYSVSRMCFGPVIWSANITVFRSLDLLDSSENLSYK